MAPWIDHATVYFFLPHAHCLMSNNLCAALVWVMLPHDVIRCCCSLHASGICSVQQFVLVFLQVYTDDDISTKFHWQRLHMLSSESTATVTWKIPEGTEDGTYMIWNYGDYKHLTGGIVPFTGHSSESDLSPPCTIQNAHCCTMPLFNRSLMLRSKDSSKSMLVFSALAAVYVH